MFKPILRSIPLFACVLCLVIPAAGNEPKNVLSNVEQAHSAAQLALTTERVVVFKDGYCLVVKRGTATTDNEGLVYTDEVPDAAILGSFWALPEQGTIKSMVAGWAEHESESTHEVTCSNVAEIIQANLGKSCTFKLDSEVMRGRLLKLLPNDDLQGESNDNAFSTPVASANPTRPSETTSVGKVTGDLFLLSTEVGDMMLPVNSVRHLTIKDMASKISLTTTHKSVRKRIAFDFGQASAAVTVNLMYFRPDVRWIPTYRVDLTDKDFDSDSPAKNQEAKRILCKTAKIFMQGELINEAEDFSDVPFHVVVGVPNFRFRSIPSPMVLESSVRNVLAQSAPDIMGNSNQLSNAMYTQRSGEFQSNRESGVEGNAEVVLPAELTGSTGNDLYVYQLEKMTLRKGERATVPILTTKVAYRDIYTWDVTFTHAETYAASSAESASPLVLTENKIWRQVELLNDSDIPWTTGAAMFVDGLQPLAQELLTYTSPGGICRVPVTVSVDLRGKVEDTEVKREVDALQWRGNNYARIGGKMDIELANNKGVSVPVEVKVRFGGKAKDVSDDGKITLQAYRPDDWVNRNGDPINNSSLVKWSAVVELGECFKPRIDYEFLLRN